ncbi:unnamed protein product [Prorocentrum cordatum]|uniref:Aquaporin n=1 Tax=Prorocentrum cordatum TaxID=2364126 RepID=A0ABN9U9N6_9DINO|nr:unnamed protein product [Polarella glacialis]
MGPRSGLLAAACLVPAAAAARAPPEAAEMTADGSSALEPRPPGPSSALERARGRRSAAPGGSSSEAEGAAAAAAEGGGFTPALAERAEEEEGRRAAAPRPPPRAAATARARTDENRSTFACLVGWATTKRGNSKKDRLPVNMDGLLPSEIAAEFIATMLLVIVGCGSACGAATKDGPAWVLQVALTFGLAVTVLECTIGHYTGGQFNCAVTFGLVLARKLCPIQGALYFAAQLGGSVTGALVLRATCSDTGKDQTGSLGSNFVKSGFSAVSALLGEIVGTFVLMYVVMETEVNPLSEAWRPFAPLAIGLAVSLAHSVLLPVDGCSINPTRSVGPALVAAVSMPAGRDKSPFMDMWIFWIGPLMGATLAVGVSSLMVA